MSDEKSWNKLGRGQEFQSQRPDARNFFFRTRRPRSFAVWLLRSDADQSLAGLEGMEIDG